MFTLIVMWVKLFKKQLNSTFKKEQIKMDGQLRRSSIKNKKIKR